MTHSPMSGVLKHIMALLSIFHHTNRFLAAVDMRTDILAARCNFLICGAIRTNLIVLETRIIDLHLPLTVWV